MSYHEGKYHAEVQQPPVLVILFVQLPPSNVVKLAWPRWGEVAAVVTVAAAVSFVYS